MKFDLLAFSNNFSFSTRAVKKIDKDPFLSVRSILSIIDKNFNLSIIINFYRFFESSPFSEKTVKNWFGGTFDNFLGKGGVLGQKLT